MPVILRYFDLAERVDDETLDQYALPHRRRRAHATVVQHGVVRARGGLPVDDQREPPANHFEAQVVGRFSRSQRGEGVHGTSSNQLS